eukprot:7966647-Lingulodinium_polyedra.AAC.1
MGRRRSGGGGGGGSSDQSGQGGRRGGAQGGGQGGRTGSGNGSRSPSTQQLAALERKMESMFQKWGSKFDSLNKAGGPAPSGRQADWTCAACGCDGNWASRALCRRCLQPRQPPPPTAPTVGTPPRAEELTDLKAVEDELKAHRASLAGFQPYADAPWAQAATASINARIEELRARQLALKTP